MTIRYLSLFSGNDVTGTLSACNGDKQFLGNQEAFSCDFHVIESVAIAGNIIGRTEGNGGNGNGFDESGACYTLTTNDRHAVAVSDVCGILTRSHGDRGVCMDSFASGQCAIGKGYVRRLTPVECERLQGFPDDYTKIPYRNKDADQCPDGPRYKALGNSMAVPVMLYIGGRIKEAIEYATA